MTRFDPDLRLSSPRPSLPLRVRAISWTAWTLGIALLGIAAPAGAAFFSAETHVLTARSSEGNASAGAEPVILNFGPSSAPDGSATGRVSGTASNGLLFASGASSSAGVKITSLGLVSATYDDVLFIYTGVEPGPAFVEIGALNYEITVFMQSQGNLGTLGGFNGREVNYSVAFNGNADGGTIRWDVSGDAGQSLIGTHKLTSSLIPVDTPITVHLEMNAGAQASLRQPGSPVTTSIAGILQIGSFDVIPTASRASLDGASFAQTGLSGPVFDLPPDFTVHSVSMGIVDNQHVVPEPSAASLSLFGVLGLALAGRTRMNRRA